MAADAPADTWRLPPHAEAAAPGARRQAGDYGNRREQPNGMAVWGTAALGGGGNTVAAGPAAWRAGGRPVHCTLPFRSLFHMPLVVFLG